jgi:hypothetical protein
VSNYVACFTTFIVGCVFLYGGINTYRTNSISMYGHIMEFGGVSAAITAAVLVVCAVPLFYVALLYKDGD